MEDYPGSKAQGSVLFSDSADWEAHAGPIDVTMCRPSFIPNHVKMALTGNSPEKLAATRVLTILTSEDAATLDVQKSRTAIVAADGHLALLALLNSEAPTGDNDMSLILAREAAAAALANLCASDDCRAQIVERGGIETFVGVLGRDECDELLKYSCGAIGNLSRDCEANQDAFAGAGGIHKLIALARAVGIRDHDSEAAEVESLLGSLDDPEADDGIELNASIALRKLAINHAANYETMRELFTEPQLRYFLHAELPPNGVEGVEEVER